jgi:pyruvate formate lyase activating enzyme
MFLMKPEFENLDYLKNDLCSCRLCAWECGVNRLEGEIGVCGITVPEVARSQLHPAPPASFDAFMTGCSFRCLSCQNWPIANYPANPFYDDIEGYYVPGEWANLALDALRSDAGKRMGADRLFFTGGEPTCSLPWCEEVVKAAREIHGETKVNYDTNGYMPEDIFKRVLSISTSITFDIKAYDPKLFNALTGADIEPVLKNAEYLARHAPGKLWEFRVLVIPHINEQDIGAISQFIAEINPALPVNFLAFRPNFAMIDHPWTSAAVMRRAVESAKDAGLENASWHGQTFDSKGRLSTELHEYSKQLPLTDNTALTIAYAHSKGCISTSLRVCGLCEAVDNCKIKRFNTIKLH